MAIDRGTLDPMPPPGDPPPGRRPTPRQWLRENLFSTWYNALLTVVFGLLLGWALYRGFRFVFATGRWEIIRANLTTFLVGLFPRAELWRPWAALYLADATLAFSAGLLRTVTVSGEEPAPEEDAGWPDALRRSWPVLLLFTVLLTLRPSLRSALLVAGLLPVAVAAWRGGVRLPRPWLRWGRLGVTAGTAGILVVLAGFGGVGYLRWGGLLMTVFITVVTIGVAFPIGILLALGRRSTLPAVRAVCVVFIEFFRGVPLLVLLFMGAFVIGFLIPPGFSRPSTLARGLIAAVAFTAAYVAEIVRGGLQSIPRGQVEAGLAVGLSRVKVLRLVVLPQALRAVIPALVGQFISFFKDTSLFVILAVFELLRAAQAVTSQGAFVGQGLQAEALVFAAFLYWVGAYSLSKESQRLERRLGVGER